MDKQALLSFLSTQRLGVLSYVAEDGSSKSALVGIAVSPDLEIVFDTVKTSRKYAHLLARKQCSFVIGLAPPTTVQYEGEAQELSGEQLERAKQVYLQAYPDGLERMSWPGIVHFIVKPRWIRCSDYSQKPPLIAQVNL